MGVNKVQDAFCGTCIYYNYVIVLKAMCFNCVLDISIIMFEYLIIKQEKNQMYFIVC